MRGVILCFLLLCCSLNLVLGQTVITSTFDGAPIWGDWDYGAGDVVFVLTNTYHLFRSQGGNAMVDISSSFPGWNEVNQPFGRVGIRGVESTADPNKLFAFGFSNNWASYDAGQSWHKIYFTEDFVVASVTPDPVDSNVCLVSSWSLSCYTSPQTNCQHRLFVTKDFGATFTLVATYVQKYMWAGYVSAAVPRIYATIFSVTSGNQLYMNPAQAELRITDNYFSSTVTILKNCSSFTVSGQFVDAGFYTSPNSAALYASGNWGKSFATVPVPSWAYAILLTPHVQSQTLFIQPGNGGSLTHGQAYHSDLTGANFVLSMLNMAYDRSSGPEFHYDASLPGIYFANVDVPTTGGNSRRVTRISRNNGGTWAPITAPTVDSLGNPTNCNASESCYLHLYLVLEGEGSFITHPSTPGLVICLGNTGSFLSTDRSQFNVYISNNAGATWRELLKGPQSVAFAQYGSIIVSVYGSPPAAVLQYTFDQGTTWYATNQPAGMASIIWLATTPANNSMVFIGVTGTKAYMVTFPQTAARACTSSDLMVWNPVDPLGNPCLLGRHASVTSRKPGSACLVQSLPAIQFSNTPCTCNAADFECTVGYARPNLESECTAYNALSRDVANPPVVDRSKNPTGPNQRLISGDVCQ